jgi:hypothetical protein
LYVWKSSTVSFEQIKCEGLCFGGNKQQYHMTNNLLDLNYDFELAVCTRLSDIKKVWVFLVNSSNGFAFL